MSNYYGIVTIASGVRSIADVGAGGLSGVLLGNESGLTVKVTLDGCGVSRSLYPGYVDFLPIPARGFNGNIFFDPQANLTNVTSWPSSYVQIDTFGTNEQPTGTYPVALSRAQNVGNPVNTVGGGSLYVQNDNNATTDIVEATPSGASSSTLLFDNQGNVTVKSNNGGVLTTLLQLIAGASPQVKLAAAAVLTEALGNLKVDGTLESVGAATMDSTLSVSGSSSLDNAKIVTDGSGNITKAGNIVASGKYGVSSAGDVLDGSGYDTYINARGATNTVHFRVNGADKATVDTNGNINANGSIIAAGGKFGTTTTGDVLDASGYDTYLKARGSTNTLHFQYNGDGTPTAIATMSSSGMQLLVGTLTVGTGTSIVANLITAQSSNDLAHHVGSGNRVVDTVNSVDIFQVNSSGPSLLSGTLGLLTGSIARISKFSGSSANGKVTVAHGLGATPDLVLVNFNLSSTPVAATIGPNYSTLTSTNVDIWASVAANFVGVAIKF